MSRMDAEQVRLDWERGMRAPREETVEEGRVRDFLMALDEPVDLAPDQPVPPLFLITIGRNRRPELPTVGGLANGGTEVEPIMPLYIGDRITPVVRVADVQEKHGKMGRMFVLTIETTYVNQRGETVGVSRRQPIRWGI